MLQLTNARKCRSQTHSRSHSDSYRHRSLGSLFQGCLFGKNKTSSADSGYPSALRGVEIGRFVWYNKNNLSSLKEGLMTAIGEPVRKIESWPIQIPVPQRIPKPSQPAIPGQSRAHRGSKRTSERVRWKPLRYCAKLRRGERGRSILTMANWYCAHSQLITNGLFAKKRMLNVARNQYGESHTKESGFQMSIAAVDSGLQSIRPQRNILR